MRGMGPVQADPAAATPRLLCLVLHDVAPGTWDACRRVYAAVAEVAADVPTTLLAVPRYHRQPRSAPFERWLCDRADAGDEVALHGFTHLDDGTPRDWLDHLKRRHYTRGEGEFSDLDADEAERRLRAGLGWLGDVGLEPAGFVAPAWLLGVGARAALTRLPMRFAYTCTLKSVVRLPGWQRVDAGHSLVYSNSTAWRRWASRLWVPSLAARQAREPLQRLELHPGDVDDAGVRRSWQRLLGRLLEDREPVTLVKAVRRLSPPAAVAVPAVADAASAASAAPASERDGVRTPRTSASR